MPEALMSLTIRPCWGLRKVSPLRARLVWPAAVAVLIYCGSTITCFSLGIRIPDHGARATGQSDAFTAQADDVTAIYYNAAGLTQLEGTHVASGAYLWFPNYDFNGTGTTEEMNKWALIPHFYVATDFGQDAWRFGLGINSPFGTGVDWGDNGAFQFIVTKARLTVVNFAPTVAYKVNEHLSVGLNLNVYYADANLENRVFFAPPPFPEGYFRFHGTGLGVGATVGALWKINERHAVGVVYRSPFEIEVDGSAKLNPQNPGFASSSTSTDLNFPQIIDAGYAFRPIKKLKLEADLEWINWDVANKIRFRSSNAAFDGTTIPLRWRDSFAYKVGAEYEIDEHWAVRAGYAFWENSVPNSTYSPLVPDADYHSVTAGVGYSASRWGIDVAYQANISEGRKVSGSVNSPAVNGKWDFLNHAVILTSRFKF